MFGSLEIEEIVVSYEIIIHPNKGVAIPFEK